MRYAPDSKRLLAVAALVALGVALIGAGEWLSRAGLERVCDGELWEGARNLRRCERYFYPVARGGAFQLGALGLVAGAGSLALGYLAPHRRTIVRARARSVALHAIAIAGISFVTGEIALRALFWDGVSFGTHDGPLVNRFERHFVLNRHDGPSRGPEVSGPKLAGAKRILIQGDSITWGQGVRRESDIYSQRLLDALRRRNPRVEVAALAKGGREINGHLEQLQRHGREIDPDAIVYQWFINDIELDKSGRPDPHPPWRDLFFHQPLAATSAFWFFLDFSIAQRWPTERTYVEYIEAEYAEGTAKWRRFEEVFGAWAREARELTPQVVVALYPRVKPPLDVYFPEVQARVASLARAHGLEAVDLIHAFEGLDGDYRTLQASRFDPHPSALAHARVAEHLERFLIERWPGLVE